MKQVIEFSADNLIKTCKIIFSEYGLPGKIVSDAGTNVISEKFDDFCKEHSTFKIEYHHHTTTRAISNSSIQ